MALISSLTDNFSAPNTTVWSYGTGASVSGGALNLAAAATWTVQAHTKAQYSFVGSTVFAKVTIGDTSDRTFLFDLRTELADSNNRFGLEISGGTKPVIFLYRFVAGAYASAPGVLYNPTSHAWLRLRESAGVGYLDASPDGVAWTQLSSLSYSTLALSACNLLFTSRQNSGTSVDMIASLNIAPVSPPPPPPPGIASGAPAGHGVLSATESVVTPPPPPPPAGSISALSDLLLLFARKTFYNPAVQLTPDFQIVTTPFGPGWQCVVSDTTDVTLWDNTMKAVLAKVNPGAGKDVAMNTTQQWDAYLYLPTQGVVTSWNGGVLMEFHTPGVSSGHTVELDNTGRGPGGAGVPSFRFGFQHAAGANYLYTWAPLTFNTWHHVTIKVRWSLGTDGFYQLSLDGTQYVNHTGVPTVYSGDGGTPFLQFGLYADIGTQVGVAGVGNSQVTIAGLTVTNS